MSTNPEPEKKEAFDDVQNQELVSVNTLSNLLDIPKGTIRDWVFRRKIPYCKIHGRIVFNLKKIREWYNSKLVRPTTQDLIYDSKI